jgi:hypothetical protein
VATTVVPFRNSTVPAAAAGVTLAVKLTVCPAVRVELEVIDVLPIVALRVVAVADFAVIRVMVALLVKLPSVTVRVKVVVPAVVGVPEITPAFVIVSGLVRLVAEKV